ncbi:MobP2 family relaxase [Lactobacillus sp. HT06-2]|uniref:MobP2 family relaxase n=1 Tax=Lactobacillus sp. HT06-2 TaxID=2080222 RepID=UPI000CD89686|nr:MobP2 family relaxase [Lactobacillus sp. HT06-2]
MNRPAIILTSKFSAPNAQKTFGRYVGYMARKEALEQKEYLSEKEKSELDRVETQAKKLDQKYNFSVIKSEEHSKREKEAKELIEKKSIFDLNDKEFDKYLGYMVRIDALNHKKENSKLTAKEQSELEKIGAAANRLSELHATKEKVLDGVFSSDKNVVQLKDLNYIREQLNEGQKNNSVLWQDVVSFDNSFLKKKGILSSTGILNEEELQKATKKMQSVFQNEMDPPLNNMYWVAFIHRNTDNVHIHIATVERDPRRKLINRDGISQPKGRRPQKIIDHMKSSFANELIGSSELTKELSQKRQTIREAIQINLTAQVEQPTFQAELNEFIKILPESRRKWFYNKLNEPQKKMSNHLVDELLKDNSDFQKYKDLVWELQNDRQSLYGKSKRDNKNYAINQLYGKEGIYARNGNALLADLRKIDKQANHNQRHRVSFKEKVDPNKYIQSALEEIYKQKSKKENVKSSFDESYAPHPHGKSKTRNIKGHYLKKPFITQSQIRKIKSNQEKVFEKTNADRESRKNLREFEKLQNEVEKELE